MVVGSRPLFVIFVFYFFVRKICKKPHLPASKRKKTLCRVLMPLWTAGSLGRSRRLLTPSSGLLSGRATDPVVAENKVVQEIRFVLDIQPEFTETSHPSHKVDDHTAKAILLNRFHHADSSTRGCTRESLDRREVGVGR